MESPIALAALFVIGAGARSLPAMMREARLSSRERRQDKLLERLCSKAKDDRELRWYLRLFLGRKPPD